MRSADGKGDDGETAGSGEGPRSQLALVIRPVTVDELAVVRYIHEAAFKRDAATHFREDEIAAFGRVVYDASYCDRMLGDQLHAAFLGADMVGTAAWVGSSDGRATARIKHVYVRPFFTGLGIGHRLVGEMERLAGRAGYADFNARSTLNAIGFFETLGYAVASYGVRVLTQEHSLAVAFMRKSARTGGLH